MFLERDFGMLMQMPPEFHLPRLLLLDLLQDAPFYVICYGHFQAPGVYVSGLMYDEPQATISS
jgi:hypothetical protein